MIRAAIYARVSTDEQANNYSLPSQVKECQKFAQEKGYSVVAELREDYSGAKIDRPELDKLRDLAKNRLIDRVIVYSIDRLSRIMAHQIIIEAEMQRLGVKIDFVLSDYEDSATGRLQKNIGSTIAEFEREQFLERTRRGKHERVRSGFVLPAAVAPYGYQYVKDPAGHKGTYTIREDESKIVRLIFRWYVAGDENGRKLGRMAIATRLTEMGIPTRYDYTENRTKKRDYAAWSKRTVGSVLTSEIYMGTYFYNKTMQIDGQNGRRCDRPREEWLSAEVPAIISREIWNAAQSQKDVNRIHSKRNVRYEYLMQSRLICAKCGRIFQCNTNSRGNLLLYYTCDGQKAEGAPDRKTKTCKKSLVAPLIDEQVWEHIKTLLQHPESVLDTFQSVREEQSRGLDAIRERLSTIEDLINERQRKIKKLLDLYLEDALSKELMQDRQTGLQKEITQLTAEGEQLRQHISDNVISDESLEAARRFCEQAVDGLEFFTYEDKRTVIATLDIKGFVTRSEDKITIAISGFLPGLDSVAFEVLTS